MGTSTGGNGTTGIQLPSVAWEMEEEGDGATTAPSAGPVPSSGPSPSSGAGAGAASAAAGAAAVAAAAPPAVPQYGPPTPEASPTPAAVPAPDPGSSGSFPEEPGALEPVAPEPEGGAPDGALPGRRARFKRPALVAAATAGVVLMGLPFLITDGADRRDGHGGRGDDLGVNQPDLQLVDGPQIDDAPVPPAPVDPPVTGDPTAAPTEAAPVQGPIPGTPETPVIDGVPAGQPVTAAVPGAAPNPQNTRPSNGSAPVAKAPGGGGTQQQGSGGGSGSQPAQGQPPAGQQPAPPAAGQPPAAQQPAPPAAGQPPVAQQPAPPPATQQPVPPVPAQPPAAAKATYKAVGGTGCSTSSATYAQHGWYEQDTKGWLNNSAGGYTGSGCNGKYVSMPMSGAEAKDDTDNWVLWTFSTAPVTNGSCKIAVYVPNNSDVKAVGAAPAYYTVQNASGGTIGDFPVNQRTNRGSWVTGGTFAVSGGKIAVKLHSRGIDWNDKAHIAASAVSADCTAA
ncbi:hypothetical protein ACFVYP_20125 [Kitasatospora sp. NPDC058201]|uniref:hypothetical protein n=1 Tax=unclassified Kitasatospora TaxID=2633591 RepID=UPI0036636856